MFSGCGSRRRRGAIGSRLLLRCLRKCRYIDQRSRRAVGLSQDGKVQVMACLLLRRIVDDHRAPRSADGAAFQRSATAYGFIMGRPFGRRGTHMEAESIRPGARRHACPLVSSPLSAEKNAVCDGIIKGHEGANELTLVDSESMRPNQITIGRNTTSPGLKLGNKRVVLSTHPSGQLPLR